ncbi:uncharacterized protein LOC106771796 [Vigna radiata var. radiata]|uniref:Uncharacterized protein LOC106771796 n=1 Tax=Vigna radiata var. radiata TaxID=3916 RepID=A0A1S3V501_VIGRR|nr:uncharacterized protein LOC106771796 [Vigna radiata var. radiata]
MASTEFTLVSPAIDNEGKGKLPRYCTQEGLGSKWDISPPLEWYNLPPETKSMALVVQDIDAVDPTGNPVALTHWVVVNIPVSVKGLPEGFSGKKEEVGGEYEKIEEGVNDWKVRVWRGPKLPNYEDRFEFRLYALDDFMVFDNQVTKTKLLDAIAGHVLEEAIFTATF